MVSQERTVASICCVPLQLQDIGVEIEVEGRNLWKGNDEYWRSEHDGSLRGDDNVEYVLKSPLTLPKLKIALLHLNANLKRKRSKVDMSRRTSTHIHINCTPLTFKELVNYIVLLIIYEELLVDWCEPSRRGNLFCLQSKDAEGLIPSIKKFVKGMRVGQLGNHIRYSAINISSLAKYGSVEVRALEGTVAPSRILTWAGLLLHLREVAKTFENPVDIISNLSLEEPLAFSKRVLGTYSSEFFKGVGRGRKVIDGARRAQDIAYCRGWGEEEEIPKDILKREDGVRAPQELVDAFIAGHDAFRQEYKHKLEEEILRVPPEPLRMKGVYGMNPIFDGVILENAGEPIAPPRNPLKKKVRIEREED
jgi:hypothetical protein